MYLLPGRRALQVTPPNPRLNHPVVSTENEPFSERISVVDRLETLGKSTLEMCRQSTF